MKIAKPIVFHIPALFVSELDKCIKQNPPKSDYNISYFYFLMNRLTTNHYTKDKKKEFTNMNTQKLQKLSIYRIGSYMKYLKKYEFIISDNNYIPGEKSLEYKLNEKLLSGEYYFELLPETRLFKNIIHNQRMKKTNYAKMPDYLQKMKDLFMDIDFDYEAARDWIENNSTEAEKHFRRTMLLQFQDKRFRYFGRNKTNNRIDTNLTSIKKELRYCLKGDWISFDLKNSQPFFLFSDILRPINHIHTDHTHHPPHTPHHKPIGITYHNPICVAQRFLNLQQSFGVSTLQKISKCRKKDDFAKNTTLSFELNKFGEAVFTGKYYESIMNGNLTREEAKNTNWGVYFSKNREQTKYLYFIPYKKEKEIFAGIYPCIYEIIELLKEKDHAKLSVYLTSVESFVFIDTIASRLVQAGIMPLTVHDSVLVPAKHKDEAKQIIDNVFRELYGRVPAFHIESYKKLKALLN